MASHLTHVGVHDHGFNNVSTYGNLWRLAREGRIDATAWEVHFYELALKVSGAVQARRWTRIPDGGFIHSFNGPHSLFVDTMRSLRALALGHVLGQPLMEEQDCRVSLLDRLVEHARATARYNVYFGGGRDRYDVRGRTAHESLFNPANGTYRGPSSQQGYSPFTTWTRGLAWAMLGFAEQIRVPRERAGRCAGAGRRTCRHRHDDGCRGTRNLRSLYRDSGCRWRSLLGRRRTGAPALGDWGARAADPFNDHEPVDSSAAAIAAQGLLRLGRILQRRGDRRVNDTGRLASGLLDTLFDSSGPYLSTDANHQGLLLHSVYHWPNRWDYVPPGAATPRGESSQWGDYHAREAALYVKRLAEDAPGLDVLRGTPQHECEEPPSSLVARGGSVWASPLRSLPRAGISRSAVSGRKRT